MSRITRDYFSCFGVLEAKKKEELLKPFSSYIFRRRPPQELPLCSPLLSCIIIIIAASAAIMTFDRATKEEGGGQAKTQWVQNFTWELL